MAINKVLAWAWPVFLFIGNESEEEDANIFHNSDKTVGLLDSDSYDSPLLLTDDSNADFEREEDPNIEGIKSIYPPIRTVVYDDLHVHEFQN